MAKIEELQEGIAKLLEEPEIQFMDWELGKALLQAHKAGLPSKILTYLHSQGIKLPGGSSLIKEIWIKKVLIMVNS